jgi:hypothetical protein
MKKINRIFFFQIDFYCAGSILINHLTKAFGFYDFLGISRSIIENNRAGLFLSILSKVYNPLIFDNKNNLKIKLVLKTHFKTQILTVSQS